MGRRLQQRPPRPGPAMTRRGRRPRFHPVFPPSRPEYSVTNLSGGEDKIYFIDGIGAALAAVQALSKEVEQLKCAWRSLRTSWSSSESGTEDYAAEQGATP